MTPVVPAVAGALITAGLLCLAGGLMRRPEQPPAPTRRARTSSLPRASARTRTLLLAGTGVGALVALFTGWFVAVLLVPAALAGLPVLLSAPPAGKEVARLEALEEWVRSLSGVLTAGVGLEQALISSLRSTPEPIRPEVTRLVGRLRARWDTQAALRALADDLHDATGDLIVANLLLGARRRGAGLATVLHALAESVAADVTARREIEADRAKPRTTARLITVITIGALVFLSLSGEYIVSFGTPLGQVLLVVLLTVYGGILAWMRVMARGRPLPRIFGDSGGFRKTEVDLAGNRRAGSS